MSHASFPCFVGIDVSKDHLDLAVRPSREYWRVPHTPKEFPALVARLRALAPERVVLEATGGLETLLATELAAAGLPVAIVNPRQARDFAKGTGQLAKTDKVDAHVLAHFGEAVKPPVRPLPSDEARELAALLTRRRQLVEMLVAERNRLTAAAAPRVVKDLRAHIAWLEKRVAACDDELRQRLEASPAWRVNDELLRSAPGVGAVTSRPLLAALPELGQLTHKPIGALGGVVPRVRESGRWRGQSYLCGGRAEVRAVLYMATLTAVRCNRVIRAFYERLVAAGKPRQVALTACMHKLLTRLNAMVKHQTPWRESAAGVPQTATPA